MLHVRDAQIDDVPVLLEIYNEVLEFTSRYCQSHLVTQLQADQVRGSISFRRHLVRRTPDERRYA